MKNLFLILKKLYPDLEPDRDYVLKDDGNGVYIFQWNTNIQKPSDEELQNTWEKISLEEDKKNKLYELDELCESAILGRFKVNINDVEYEFSYDEKAQSRFNGSPYLFSSGIIDSIEWTCYLNGERTSIMIDQTKFNIIAKAAFEHQNTNIEKFRQKIKELDDAQSIQEINLIKW